MSKNKASKVETKSKQKQSKCVIDVHWRSVLDHVAINEELWKCSVAVMVENEPGMGKCITGFANVAASGRRKSVRCLSFSELVANTKSIGNSYNAGNSTDLTEKLPGYGSACVEALPFVSSKNAKGLPVELLAKLIKYEILRLKDQWMMITGYEQEKMRIAAEEMDAMWKPNACPVTGTTTGQKPAGNKGDKKQAKDKSMSKLQKHGTDIYQIDYIDDVPKGGPNLYIVLCGFHHTDVIKEIMKTDIPLNSIIRLGFSPDTINKDSITEELDEAIALFWKYVDDVKHNKDEYGIYKNIMLIKYLLNDIEVGKEDKTSIFDQISLLLYEIDDITRYHINYLRHMMVQDCQEFRPPLKVEDFKLYNKILDELPPECMTVPLIMHGILEEVCFEDTRRISEESRNKSNKSLLKVLSKDRSMVLKSKSNIDQVKSNKSVKSILEKVNSKGETLEDSKDVESFLQNKICQPNTSKFAKLYDLIFNSIQNNNNNTGVSKQSSAVNHTPVLLKYGDEINLRTYHLQEKSLDYGGITTDLLEHTLVPSLWKYYPIQDYVTSIIYKKHINQMFATHSVFPNTDPQLYSLYALLFESFKNIDSLVPFFGHDTKLRNHSKKDQEQARASVTECMELCEFVCTCRNYPEDNTCTDDSKDYAVIEEFDKTAMLQLLYSMADYYQCMDFCYYIPTDVVLLRCFNERPHTYGNLWKYSLTTPVCIRDFVKFILDDESEWINQQDEEFRKACQLENDEEKKKTMTKSVLDMENLKKQQEDKFKFEDFLLPGSLKEKAKEAENLELAKSSKNVKAEKSESKKKDTKETKSSKEKDKKKKDEGVKSKGNIQVKLEKLPDNSVFRKLSLRTAKEGEPFCFHGYDLGSSRVQISGKTTTLYSDDGTSIIIEKSKWLNEEKLLKVIITKARHSMYFYTPCSYKPKVVDSLKFHINVSNGTILAFETRKKKTSSQTELIEEEEDELPTTVTCAENMPFRSKEKLETDVKDLNLDGMSMLLENKSNAGSFIETKSRASKRGSIKSGAKRRKSSIASNNEESSKEKYTANPAVLTYDEIKNSKYLRTKSEILLALENAKTNTTPCYKIISSKLHSYNYVKRIKPHSKININALIRRLIKQNASEDLSKRYSTPTTSFTGPYITKERQHLDFDFSASCPSGLTVQTVPSIYKHDRFYIKQYYVSKGPICERIQSESKRCFLSNGMVMIFMKNNKFKILCSDSSVFICKMRDFKSNSLTSLNKIRDRLKWEANESRKEAMMPKIYTFRVKNFLRNLNKKVIDLQTKNKHYLRHMYLKRLKFCFRRKPKLRKGYVPVPDYVYISPLGVKCTIRNNKVAYFPTRYIVQSAAEYTEGEIYTEREDGTRSLLNAEGVLVTSFPDGTRITSSFVVENDEIFCRMSNDDNEEEDMVEMTELRKISQLSERISFATESDDVSEDAMPRVEGFVSVILKCTFEHPNYGTVSYDGVDKSGIVNLPGETRVKVTKNGCYEIHLVDNTTIQVNVIVGKVSAKICNDFIKGDFLILRYICGVDIQPAVSQLVSLAFGERVVYRLLTAFVKINKNFIDFHTLICQGCSASSYAKINIEPLVNEESKSMLDPDLGCLDIFKNFYVKNFDSNCSEIFINFEGDIERVDNKSFAILHNHGKPSWHIPKNRYFVLNRDLSGSEFLSWSIKEISSRSNVSVNFENWKYNTYLTSTIKEFTTYSEQWLMPYILDIVEPTFIKRQHVKPLSYEPGWWLSVLPRNTTTSHISISGGLNSNALVIPKALIERSFLNITNPEKPIFDFAEASLAKYNEKIAENVSSMKHSKYLPDYKYQGNSAHDFKLRWAARVREVDFYKDMLRNKKIPPYFSENMKNILYEDGIVLDIDSNESNADRKVVKEEKRQPCYCENNEKSVIKKPEKNVDKIKIPNIIVEDYDENKIVLEVKQPHNDEKDEEKKIFEFDYCRCDQNITKENTKYDENTYTKGYQLINTVKNEKKPYKPDLQYLSQKWKDIKQKNSDTIDEESKQVKRLEEYKEETVENITES